MIDQRSPTWFSTGVPVRAIRLAACERPRGLGLLGLGVLDVLGLVQDQVRPVDLPEQLEVAVQERIAREDQGLLRGLLLERRPAGPLQAVVDHHREVGREPGGLLVPVADDGHRADEQRRPPLARRARLPFALDQCQGLDRLAQAHVVGQAGAQAPSSEEGQPGIAAELVGPQGAVEAVGRVEQLEARGAFELVEQVVEPARCLDAREGERAGRLRLAERHPHGLARRDRRLGLLFPERQRGADLLGADLDPLAADLDQGRLELRQGPELLERERLVAEGDLPVELEDLVEREAGLAGHLRRRRRPPGPRAAAGSPLARPPGGEEDAEAGLFQRAGLCREELVRAGGVEVVAGGRGGLEAGLDRRGERGRLAQRGEQVLARPEAVAAEDLPPPCPAPSRRPRRARGG